MSIADKIIGKCLNNFNFNSNNTVSNTPNNNTDNNINNNINKWYTIFNTLKSNTLVLPPLNHTLTSITHTLSNIKHTLTKLQYNTTQLSLSRVECRVIREMVEVECGKVIAMMKAEGVIDCDTNSISDCNSNTTVNNINTIDSNTTINYTNTINTINNKINSLSHYKNINIYELKKKEEQSLLRKEKVKSMINKIVCIFNNNNDSKYDTINDLLISKYDYIVSNDCNSSNDCNINNTINIIINIINNTLTHNNKSYTHYNTLLQQYECNYEEYISKMNIIKKKESVTKELECIRVKYSRVYEEVKSKYYTNDNSNNDIDNNIYTTLINTNNHILRNRNRLFSTIDEIESILKDNEHEVFNIVREMIRIKNEVVRIIGNIGDNSMIDSNTNTGVDNNTINNINTLLHTLYNNYTTLHINQLILLDIQGIKQKKRVAMNAIDIYRDLKEIGEREGRCALCESVLENDGNNGNSNKENEYDSNTNSNKENDCYNSNTNTQSNTIITNTNNNTINNYINRLNTVINKIPDEINHYNALLNQYITVYDNNVLVNNIIKRVNERVWDIGEIVIEDCCIVCSIRENVHCYSDSDYIDCSNNTSNTINSNTSNITNTSNTTGNDTININNKCFNYYLIQSITDKLSFIHSNKHITALPTISHVKKRMDSIRKCNRVIEEYMSVIAEYTNSDSNTNNTNTNNIKEIESGYKTLVKYERIRKWLVERMDVIKSDSESVKKKEECIRKKEDEIVDELERVYEEIKRVIGNKEEECDTNNRVCDSKINNKINNTNININNTINHLLSIINNHNNKILNYNSIKNRLVRITNLESDLKKRECIIKEIDGIDKEMECIIVEYDDNDDSNSNNDSINNNNRIINNTIKQINNRINHYNTLISRMNKEIYQKEGKYEQLNKSIKRMILDIECNNRKYDYNDNNSDRECNINSINNTNTLLKTINNNNNYNLNKIYNIQYNINTSYNTLYTHTKILNNLIVDLNILIKCIEQSVLVYQNNKINELNNTLNYLWINTYTGGDISNVRVVCVDSSGSIINGYDYNDSNGYSNSYKSNTKSKSNTNINNIIIRKSFTYKVVQVRDGTALDIKTKCSAGQKVLFSILFRIALGLTFLTNSNVLITLDEPTTNLDIYNIESLASTIRSLRMVGKLQLIIITHDEEFVNLIGRDCMECYWKIRRVERGCVLERHSMY